MILRSGMVAYNGTQTWVCTDSPGGLVEAQILSFCFSSPGVRPENFYFCKFPGDELLVAQGAHMRTTGTVKPKVIYKGWL